MPEIPYHVIGGSFATALANPLAEFLAAHKKIPEEGPAARRSSRRRRLWEVPHKFHCPIIGSCFEVGELRALMAKAMHFPPGTTDFVLHTTAVGACETRSQLADLLQRQLEKRFQPSIRHLSSHKETAALRQQWLAAVRSGSDIPATLWAIWTHPACDSQLEHELYADIHMIQHQIGSGIRTDRKTLERFKEENRKLRQHLDKAQGEAEAARREKAEATQQLGQRIAELRAEQVGRDACIANLTAQLEQLRETLPELRDRQALARRASDAEARLATLDAHIALQKREIDQLRERLATQGVAEEEHESACPELVEETPETLSGKCVLCVGGRSGAVDAYRQLVEQRGGRFLHHDGGLEESLHRIDGALAAADLVICQTGCISHNAYWRVKERCKRSGKPCVFVKGSGVSSFGRVVGAACGTDDSL
ncbi:MAG: DUF2325 domain-containing protein [Betaproteobacteria bacterium HGW-Betaproteobacteria-7]|jgi:hypothetical protein|nr:MAG: DUF2325 domain-containing protein [Betaproteobacteria bacterium HGW-Betaproteobacteria-7]